MATKQNYVLGRGEVHFAPFLPGTQTPGGYRYLGNTPMFSFNFESADLDHKSSDYGINEVDDSAALGVTRTGSLTTDNISIENVALFFLGSATALAVSATTITDEPILGIVKGRRYQLGESLANPSGARNVVFPGASGTLFAVKKAAAVMVSGTDYLLEPATGMLEILETGSTLLDGDNLLVTYSLAASTRSRVISGSVPIEGAMKFIARNPKGDQKDAFMPWVTMSPNGDYNLKGESEWQAIPFKLKIVKKVDREAVYFDTRATSP